jgi:hypothetical protein
MSLTAPIVSSLSLNFQTPPYKRQRHSQQPFSPGELGKLAMINSRELARLAGITSFFSNVGPFHYTIFTSPTSSITSISYPPHFFWSSIHSYSTTVAPSNKKILQCYAALIAWPLTSLRTFSSRICSIMSTWGTGQYSHMKVFAIIRLYACHHWGWCHKMKGAHGPSWTTPFLVSMQRPFQLRPRMPCNLVVPYSASCNA